MTHSAALHACSCEARPVKQHRRDARRGIRWCDVLTYRGLPAVETAWLRTDLDR